MHVAPTTLDKLAFERVLDALAERCQTLAGQARARSVRPDLDLEALALAHERVDEALTGDAIALGGVEDVRPLVERVVDGGVLEGPECLAIAYTMDSAATVKRAVATSGRPRLTELVTPMGSFDAALRSVREQLDAQGEVRDDATPKLREIRRRLQPLRGRIRERMAQLLQQYATHVQDPIVTLRRDRYVIPVKASSQSRVPGLVLDTSDSGATVFVEPAAVVPMNNELALLEFEDRDEVRRILVALGQRLAFDPALEATLEALEELDLVAAGARLARDWKLARPEVGADLPVRLPAARHPLIEGCVPNDVFLDDEARLLVLTGPNAGGKTVLLKTLGLAVLMAHAGLFVAAGSGGPRPSRVTLPAFRAVLTDIGDEQSIEASLSTYAAHLTNLKRIVEHAGRDTLVLIDELGSGTDPDEGAALSQAILERVLAQQAFGVVTTHLAPLKVFAAQRVGVRNAAMRFDVERLRPTFELVVGQPGRSYALAIADRVGLGAALLERAAEVLGPEGARLERLLETLERQREALQGQLDQARGARDEAVGEAAVLRAQIEKLRGQEAALLERAAAKADALLHDTMERARSARAVAKVDPAQRGKAVEAIAQLRRETKAKAPRAPRAPTGPKLGVGSVVRVESYGAEGPVVEERGDALLVQLGLLKVEVPRHEAVLVRGAEPAKVAAPVAPDAGFDRELNVRGERVEDALEKVRTFVEEAQALKVASVRILHGKGTGALRDAVRRYLRDERRVERFEDAVPYEGGHGVTVAYLRV
ncbi:MAG: endonuclease MutS2 [Trueperaceae bacterium]